MKKKLSILLTLALATFIATGCESLDEFFGVNEQPQTEQKEENKETEGNKEENQNNTDEPGDENAGDENQSTNPGDPDTPTTPDTPSTPDQPGDPDTPTTPDQPGDPDTPSTPDTPSGDYYSQCSGLSGSALQAKLLAINKPKSPSYEWSRYEQADEAEDDSTCILSIYTRHNIKKSNHCGSYSWTTWNREHVWTQSKYPKSDEDNHNIFACEGQINNYRGNLPFAEGGSVVTVFGHTTGCKMVKDTSFEPCDEAKGEIARSVMYGTVMYTYTMTEEIESIELALKWHIQHEITSRETKRNEVVYQNQGNRNPFVDHPEYACKIWGTTNAATKSLCGIN